LFALQNPADLETVLGLHSEICPTSSHDACLASSIKAEVLSDAEAEEDPVPLTFVGIKAEPEVSSVSVSMLGGFHKYRYPLFSKLLLEQLIFVGILFLQKQRNTQHGANGEKQAESAVILMLTFHP
jgi:hypothetical protein